MWETGQSRRHHEVPCIGRSSRANRSHDGRMSRSEGSTLCLIALEAASVVDTSGRRAGGERELRLEPVACPNPAFRVDHSASGPYAICFFRL